MSTICIIQARLTSSRLPGKVLLPLAGKTVIERVYARCASVLKSVVAIPTGKKNDKLAAFLKAKKIPFYRGPENDVMKRYILGAKKFRATNVVRVTSDCPLIQPELVLIAAVHHEKSGVGYTYYSGITSGFDVQVYKTSALIEAHKTATADAKEHVRCWGVGGSHAITKLSLDTPEDYELLQKLMEKKK